MGPTGEDVLAELRARIVEEIRNEALGYAGIAMASVKLGKPEPEVTEAEAAAALADPFTNGDEELTFRTIRAGETAIVMVLSEAGVFPDLHAELRIDENAALDRGQGGTGLSTPAKSKAKRGRPSRLEDLRRILVREVHFALGQGIVNSREKAIERMTGLSRQGVIPAAARLAPPIIALSLDFRTLQHWVQHVEGEAPALVRFAQDQGRRAAAGLDLDPEFVKRRADALKLVTNRDALAAMVKRATHRTAAGAARADRRPSRAKR